MNSTRLILSTLLVFSFLSAVRSAPYLDLGPLLGHVGPNEANLWVRGSEPARVSVTVGTEPDLSDGRTVEGPALTSAADLTGIVRLPDLAPSTRYYYRVDLDGAPAMLRPYPHFTTPPPVGTPGRVRIAFSSCVGRNGADTAAIWADLAARTQFDLLLMLGDNHYADSTDPEVQRPAYYDHRRVLGYADISRRVPNYAIWDDHDYGPNDSGADAAGKERSLRTFKEFWPNPAFGQPDNSGIYFRFSRGDIDFFMLDVRYHRSPNRAPDDGTKTMLGAAQLAWLKRELLASRARVKFIASGSEWQRNSHLDSWTSFAREREELFAFLRDENISGVILLSGDRHFTAGYQIDGRFLEITAGPLGSKNYPSANLPDMFLNLPLGKMGAVLDIDTTLADPKVALEVYRAGHGRVYERAFTWDEIEGRTRIEPLPVGARPKLD
jgi:Phosphodiesterase/alkaline phosphatase D